MFSKIVYLIYLSNNTLILVSKSITIFKKYVSISVLSKYETSIY